MKRNAKRILIWLLGVTVVFSLAYCGAEEVAPPMTPEQRNALSEEVEQLNTQVAPFANLFSKTLELVTPSVVSISTTKKIQVTEQPGSPEELFGPFGFGLPRSPRQSQPRKREFERSGLGSGFVIDADKGYVVTNYHVVDGVDAEDIKVTFADGREVTANNVFRDQKTEVALISIPAEGLVALEWGDSDALKAGQWVIAIGSPMGFGNTATTGISAPRAPRTASSAAAGAQVFA